MSLRVGSDIPVGTICWKKAWSGNKPVVVKMLTTKPGRVGRFLYIGNKWRLHEVYVLSITDDTGREYKTARSHYTTSFIYKVGKLKSPARWTDNGTDCGDAIHAFSSERQARRYQ